MSNDNNNNICIDEMDPFHDCCFCGSLCSVNSQCCHLCAQKGRFRLQETTSKRNVKQAQDITNKTVVEVEVVSDDNPKDILGDCK